MKITKQYLLQIIKEELQSHINEMALYFDSQDEDKYTYVYRVDKKFSRGWLGPNSMMASDMFDLHDGEDDADVDYRAKLSDKLHRLLRKADSQPGPAKDFPQDEWEPVTWANRKQAKKRNSYFAFPDIQSAYDWFGQKQLEQLIKIFGFNIRKVKAKKVWISNTKSQLIFTPYTTLDDGEIVR